MTAAAPRRNPDIGPEGPPRNAGGEGHGPQPRHNKSDRPTRGAGKLEGLAARWRAGVALRALKPELRGGEVLDIGCGSFPVFLMRAPFARKVGVDQIPSGLTPAEARQVGLEILRLSLAGKIQLPFPDATFACVTSLACIEHLDPDALPPLMAEIRRVLKPGGQALLTTPHARADLPLRFMAALGLISREEIDEHQSLFTADRIGALLAQAGFAAGRIRVQAFQLGMNILAVAEK